MELKHIYKTLGGKEILHDISLHIEPGERVGLLGPNGAGKSTLMKIIVGLWDSDKHPEKLLQVPEHIGYLPEQNPLYDEMYVREFLDLMIRLAKVKMDVEELIQRVGLTPEANKKIGQLSKGYRQRVGLAQALIGQPELIILDEPTTGLDPNQLIPIRQLIRDLDGTVILSTHILQEVKEMCSRVIIINHGRICADKPLSEIDDLAQLFTQATEA